MALAGQRLRAAAQAVVSDLGDDEVEITLSTDGLARDGHVLVPQGGRLAEFKANPIILWSHDPAQPVGRASDVRVEGNKIVARVQFAPTGVSPKADEVRGLVKSGIVRGVSIGFVVRDATPLDPRKPYAGQRITDWELFEGSFVSIPADTGAGVTARAAAQEKRQAQPRLVRDLYDVAWLAQFVTSLACLQDSVEWEAAYEEDGSPIPGQIKDVLAQLGQILVDMTAEEVAELLADEAGERAASDTPGRQLVRAFAKLVRGAPRLDTRAPEQHAVSVRLDPAQIAELVRAGRVLSADNERCLREAHEHMTRSCEMVRGLLDLVGEADNTEDDPADPADAEERDLRERRARALRHRMELTPAE